MKILNLKKIFDSSGPWRMPSNIAKERVDVKDCLGLTFAL